MKPSLITIRIGKEHKRKIFPFILLLTALWSTSIPAQSPKSDQLKERMAQISLLSSQLDSQKIHAIQIRQKLYAMQKEYLSEILSEKKKSAIQSFKQIPVPSTIYYNLLLISQLRGYIMILNEKIRDYQIGTDKLTFLNQQVEDAIKVISTLNDMKIDALLSQIELVREQYIPDAHTIILPPKEIHFPEAQSVWDLILSGKI